jgi:hypothetical protein
MVAGLDLQSNYGGGNALISSYQRVYGTGVLLR